MQVVKLSVQRGEDAELCLQSLFVTDPASDREGIITAKGERTAGTCSWILSKEQYEAWAQLQNGLLWISGPPGKGKTFLAVFLTQHLEKTNPDATVIFFFCDNKVASRNTAVNILRGLLYQLILRHPDLISTVLLKWKVQRDRLFSDDSFETLWSIFQDMVTQLADQKIYCVLDALDECAEASLMSLLSKLKKLFDTNAVSGNTHKLKLTVLSREYPQCLPQTLSAFPRIRIDEEKSDIQLFLADRIATLVESKGIEGTPLHGHILKIFTERSEGTFLWVSFMAQELESKTLKEIETSLDHLPRDLSAIYDRILSQIISHDNERDRLNLLSWLTLASRPLDVGELCEALQIEPTENLSRAQVCMDLVRSLIPLVQTSRPTFLLESMPSITKEVVTFVHQSAKDYIIGLDTAKATKYMLNSNEGRMAIANHLIRYLDNLSLVNGYAEAQHKFPLMCYAVDNWYHHFRQLGDDCRQIVKENSGFFKKGSKIRAKWWSLKFQESVSDIPLLHLACALCLPSLAQFALSKYPFAELWQPKVNQKLVCWDQTPLEIACRKGDEETVQVLLRYRADIRLGKKERSSPTAFHLAINSPKVFRALAETDAGKKIMHEDISSQTRPYGKSLLHLAAQNGQESICRDLIEQHQYDIHMTNAEGLTALHEAIADSQIDVARTLIKRYGASTSDAWGLLMAAERVGYRWTEVKPDFKDVTDTHLIRAVRFLTEECDIDIDTTDSEGNTILHVGSWVSTYLSLGANPGHRNKEGRTFLYPANMSYGVENSVLRSALQDERFDINNQDNDGKTVLHALMLSYNKQRAYFIWHSYLKSLLDFGADRHIRDSQGKVARDYAVMGREHALKEHSRDIENGWTYDDYDNNKPQDWIHAYDGFIKMIDDYATVPFHAKVMSYWEHKDWIEPGREAYFSAIP